MGKGGKGKWQGEKKGGGNGKACKIENATGWYGMDGWIGLG
jgi:hypothetical protein